MVGAVLLRTVVSQADLVLVVEPILILVRTRGIQNPLRKASGHPGAIILIELPGARVPAVVGKVWMKRDDPAPHLYQILGLIVAKGAREALLKSERSRFLKGEWPSLRARLRRLGIDVRKLADVTEDQ